MAKPQRPGKGESVLCLPRDYTVVDTETTCLSTESCCLIEVSALRVREGRVAAEFSTPRGGRCKKTASGNRATWTISSRA